ncbi:MAG: bifunctional 4-hydroxy-3-methylbut-2-enyl diphosphate reductase/30S ribosomal protein S1 [Christensenellales bacterium]
MPIIVAKGAGFCVGVKQAVDRALEALEEARSAGIPAYTLGELIHNPPVIDSLAAQGLKAVSSPREANGGLLVLRSHGVSPALEAQARASATKVVDCTCPFVRRLHEAVSAYSAGGAPVILTGDRGHPEVEGTAGHCKGPVWVVSNLQDVDILPEEAGGALLVSQTTFPPSLWQEIKDRLLRRFPGLVVKETICAATTLRQQEAAKLAAQVDSMLIVGGRNSANTRKLYETCKAICQDSHLVESAKDVPAHLRNRPELRIGVTAGASTPEWSLKEVIDSMNDTERIDQAITPDTQEAVQVAQVAAEAASAPEDTPVLTPTDQTLAAPAEEVKPVPEAKPADKPASFMDQVAANMTRIRTGQTISGIVVQITDDEVCVNIGYKSDGLIKRSDLVDQDIKLGDDIDVEIVKVNDGEGNVILSQRNIVNRKVWDDLMKKYEAGEYIEAVGKEAVKGGLIASIDGVRAFIPASQLSQRYVEKISQFVGQPMHLKIIEVDTAKKRVVASRKEVIAAESAAKKEGIWSNLTEGSVVKGIVRRFASFGAFVDIGGVDGLIHITDLSWNRSAQPQDILKINQEIDVKILSLDRERERIQLGFKQLQPRPWDNIEEKYPVGEVLTRKVVRIRPFGAFVELEPGVDGLVHISQVALTRINKVEDVLQPGQEVNVKVLAVDPEAKRISLSIREALEEGASEFAAEIPGDDFSVAYQDGVTHIAKELEPEQAAQAPEAETAGE